MPLIPGTPLADNLTGTPLDDLIDAGAGNDTVHGGDGDDTIFPGGGNDLVYGEAGNDLIYLSGGDTIDGGTGFDTLEATYGAYAETFTWTSGTTAVGSGTIINVEQFLSDGGNDYYDASLATSNLAISTGAGNDTIIAGIGDDTLTGGTGNDVFAFDGSSNDLILDFGTGNTGSISDGDTTNNDFIDLTAFYNNLAQAQKDLADDGVLNHSIFGPGYTYTTIQQITGGLTLSGVSAGGLTTDTTGLAVCFGRGTQISTMRGEVRVEDLRTGDLIAVADGGYRSVVWVGFRHLDRDALTKYPKLRPITIRSGALGNHLPKRDMVVSPQHRLLVCSPIVEPMFGKGGIFVAANKLVGLPGIEQAHELGKVDYFHILLRKHEVIFAEGAPAESLFLGDQAMGMMPERQADEIAFLFPQLLAARHHMHDGLARKTPKGPKLRRLLERHGRNKVELLKSFSAPTVVLKTAGSTGRPLQQG